MRKWEISTGRCIRVWHFTKEVKHVAWCPRLGNIISACVGAAVVLIDSADDSGQYSTGQHEAQIPNMEITEHTTPKWAERSGMIFVLHSADVTKVIWHHKGDYFASMVSDGKHVMINRLSRKSSQQIFRHQKNSHSKYRLSSARPRPFYLHWIARASVRSAATNIVEETLNRHSCPELHGDSFWRGEYYRWWRRWKSFMVKTQILICQKGSN
jgi:WD40 repeat protein